MVIHVRLPILFAPPPATPIHHVPSNQSASGRARPANKQPRVKAQRGKSRADNRLDFSCTAARPSLSLRLLKTPSRMIILRQ
ncbi:hypothetical protein MHYP_G00272900 [Metynnis hypsauchen]